MAAMNPCAFAGGDRLSNRPQSLAEVRREARPSAVWPGAAKARQLAPLPVAQAGLFTTASRETNKSNTSTASLSKNLRGPLRLAFTQQSPTGRWAAANVQAGPVVAPTSEAIAGGRKAALGANSLFRR